MNSSAYFLLYVSFSQLGVTRLTRVLKDSGRDHEVEIQKKKEIWILTDIHLPGLKLHGLTIYQVSRSWASQSISSFLTGIHSLSLTLPQVCRTAVTMFIRLCFHYQTMLITDVCLQCDPFFPLIRNHFSLLDFFSFLSSLVTNLKITPGYRQHTLVPFGWSLSHKILDQ